MLARMVERGRPKSAPRAHERRRERARADRGAGDGAQVQPSRNVPPAGTSEHPGAPSRLGGTGALSGRLTQRNDELLDHDLVAFFPLITSSKVASAWAELRPPVGASPTEPTLMIRTPETVRSKGTCEPPQITRSAGSSPTRAESSSSLMSCENGSSGSAGEPWTRTSSPPSSSGEAVGDGQASEARQDQIPELGPDLGEAVEPGLLVIAARVDLAEIERRERAIPHALHAHGAGLGEAPPRLERLRSGEAEVARDEEVGVAAPLRRGEDRREGVGVAVDVRDTEDPHAGSIFGRAARRQGSAPRT